MRMRMLIRECTAVRTSIDRKSCSLRSFESGWGSNTHCSRRPCDDDKNIPSSSRPGVEPCVLGYPVPAREGCSDGPDSFRNRSGDSAWKQRPARRGQTARGEPVETQEFSIHERCRASCLAPLAQAIHDASESVQHGKHAIGLQPGHRQLAHGSGRRRNSRSTRVGSPRRGARTMPTASSGREDRSRQAVRPGLHHQRRQPLPGPDGRCWYLRMGAARVNIPNGSPSTAEFDGPSDCQLPDLSA